MYVPCLCINVSHSSISDNDNTRFVCYVVNFWGLHKVLDEITSNNKLLTSFQCDMCGACMDWIIISILHTAADAAL